MPKAMEQTTLQTKSARPPEVSRSTGPGGPVRPNPRVAQADRKALFNARVYKAALVFGAVFLLVLVSFMQAGDRKSVV